ncbi:MAG TPA: hypothetical protein VES88_06965 [Gemmatimonadaceae bacterium]|nr:hypothetical protein [Gemmatimonadaceae bacterium]
MKDGTDIGATAAGDDARDGLVADGGVNGQTGCIGVGEDGVGTDGHGARGVGRGGGSAAGRGGVDDRWRIGAAGVLGAG